LARRTRNVCTSQQIAELYAACLGPAQTPAACNAWQAANAACLACIITDQSAPRWGAVLLAGTTVQLNFATCIALAEPCNKPCSDAVMALFECEFAACNAASQCKSAPFTQVGVCDSTSLAPGCACAAYSTAAECFQILSDTTQHPAWNLCALDTKNETFESRLTAIATFMCGP
jgi:hypothetical protein